MATGELVDWARDLARQYLDVLMFREARWRHVQAVGAKASAMASAFGPDADVLVAAAWLHDIGYAPELATTGFHPLDGARFIEGLGNSRIAGLVAHHSGAVHEAPIRNLAEELAEFADERGAVRDALWACDMTTSPVGANVDFDTRLTEIQQRYGADHSVPRAVAAAGDDIRRAIRATAARVMANGITLEECGLRDSRANAC